VLQPVLTWGPACGTGVSQYFGYNTWYVTPYYVNSGTSTCDNGTVMAVSVGDQLVMTMEKQGSAWLQTVYDVQTQQSVSFNFDMSNQEQNDLYFYIEGWSGAAPAGDGNVLFTDTMITFSAPDAAHCKLGDRGANCFVAKLQASPDGTQCYTPKIVLHK
jgi:hypothetical protein